MKRIKWDIEEIVAIVDIYFRESEGKINDLNNELSNLSKILRKRAKMLGILHDSKFRNLNGMKCIFQNIRYVATNGKSGLSSVSKLHYDVLNMYNHERIKFDTILNDFIQKYD